MAETIETQDRLVKVGEIAGAFGVRGEVKLIPLLDDPKHLARVSTLTALPPEGMPGEPRAMKIVRIRPHQEVQVASIEGVTDRNVAETLLGTQLFLKRSELPVLEEDAYYEADLLGLSVVTESGADLGKITAVLFIPNANDVYETPVAMIPAIAEVVVSVDLAARKMLVRDMPGLRKDD